MARWRGGVVLVIRIRGIRTCVLATRNLAPALNLRVNPLCDGRQMGL